MSQLERICNIFAPLQRWQRHALHAAILFPIIDYVLRRVLNLRIAAALWDQALIVVLVLCAAAVLPRRMHRVRKLNVLAALYPLLAVSAAYVVADLNRILITAEGLRATLQFIPFFFVSCLLIDDTRHAVSLLRLLGAVAGAIALIGLGQAVVGVEMPSGWVDLTDAIDVRIFSIVQSPNVLGSHLALAIPICAGLAAYRRDVRERWVWAAISLLMIPALVFTFSRGAWLAFAAAVLLGSFFFDRRVFWATVAGCAAVMVFLPTISGRILAMLSPEYLEKSMLGGRLGRWLGVFDRLRGEPLFGSGPGRYGGAVAARAFGTTYVDNYYARLAAEFGLLGLIVYLGWLGRVMAVGVGNWLGRRGTREFFLLGGLLCGLLAVALHNGVENIFEVPYLNGYFWLLAGLLAVYPQLRSEEGRGEANDDGTD